MFTEVKTEGVSAARSSWLGGGVVQGGGSVVRVGVFVLLGNHCQDSSSFSAPPAPFSSP